jgi:hypothetical protein
MSANISANFNSSFNYTDWVEFYNAGSTSINLHGYSISDDPEKPEKFVITADIYISPGEYYVISLDKKRLYP